MKKLAFLLLMVVLLVFPAVAAASIGVNIDGEMYEFDPAPVMVEGRTLVPMRALFEALGATVMYEEETRTAVGQRGATVVHVPVGSYSPSINGVEKRIDVPAQFIDGRVYIPLLFVGEALGDKVWWEESTRTVFVTRFLAEEEPAGYPAGRTIDPLVSAQWLEENSDLENLVILDIRSAEDYQQGHIPQAINIPCDAFWTMRDDLIMELPEESALFGTIGSCGITEESAVVIVGTVNEFPNPPYPLAEATRVADTLLYAGIKDVAILDGGYPRWAAEGRPSTTESVAADAVTFQGQVEEGMFVAREYVQERIGKGIIIDARDADVYFGVTIEPFADKAGHIPGAKSLPTPWMWNGDGTYKQNEVLAKMASGVVGTNKNSEIIVYCGVGGYASSWWYVLTQVLGYENVSIYDGSAQEWVRYQDMVTFTWE